MVQWKSNRGIILFPHSNIGLCEDDGGGGEFFGNNFPNLLKLPVTKNYRIIKQIWQQQCVYSDR